jgi:hypothetical protein
MNTDHKKYPGCFELLTAFTCAAVLSLLCTVTALAQDVNGRSRTFVTSQQTITEDDIIRLYEYIDINVPGIISQNVSFHASGWGRFSIEEEPDDDERTEGELTYAHLDFTIDALSSMLSFGRQFTFWGPAIEQFDGVSMGSAFRGFSTKLFVGSPPELDIDSDDNRKGDIIYGGRLSHSITERYQVGAAYVKENNDSKEFREELGLDLWLSPVRWLMFEGDSVYSQETEGWSEHSYRLTIGPPAKINVFGEYANVNFEHYLSATTSNAFDHLVMDHDESYVLAGGGLSAFLTSELNTLLKVRHYNYKESGNATSYRGDVIYSYERLLIGMSATRMQGETDELQYTMLRAFISGSEGKADGAIDLVSTTYDEPFNDVGTVIDLSGTFSYRPLDNMRVGISGVYSETPDFEEEFKGLLSFEYKFGGAS